MIQPGLVLQNRYRVVQQLGKGGFSETFEVDDCGTPKVLKVLNLDNFQNPENKEKALSLFRREADVLKRLNHSGIPRVESDGYFTWLDGVSEPSHCLVMEKIDGHNLQEWLQQRGNQPISQEQAIDWLKQLVEILEHLHQQNYFHRDIKPENIMLKPDGRLVLIDFGGVREVTGTYLAKLAEDHSITALCSPGYTPKEQRDGKPLPQSDFFSLGRTFVYLLTGKQPDKLSKDDLTDELIWLNHNPKVFEPLANLIDWLMAPLLRERPQNTQVILQRLAEVKFAYAGQLSILTPTELQEINRRNIKVWWFDLSPKIRRALIGLGIGLGVATAFARVIAPILSPTKQITVQAVKGWTKTNFCFKKGSTVKIFAEGRWSNGTYVRSDKSVWRPFYGPNGFRGTSDPTDDLPVPTAKVGTLVGRIDNTQPFKIGSNHSFVVPKSGCLSLSINDNSDLDNNQGSVNVTIDSTP